MLLTMCELSRENELRLMEVVVKGHVINTLLLVFHQGVRIFLLEVNFAFSLSVLRGQSFRLQVALKLIMAITAGRVLFRPCIILGMDLQAMVANPDQRVQNLGLFQELVLVVVILSVDLESSTDLSWLLRQSQNVLLTSLVLLRCVMIAKSMVILVGSTLSVSWSASWVQLMFFARLELQQFSKTVEILVTGLERVLYLELLVIQIIQINLIVLLHLQLESLRFVLPRAQQSYDLGFHYYRCTFISYLY